MSAWKYTIEFDLDAKVACPECGGIDHYVRYGDYFECFLGCLKCGRYFHAGSEGVPDPVVADIIAEIRSLITKANGISRIG